MSRLHQGDVSAVGELYTHYGGQVYAYALSILKNTTQAEDASSETFVRFYRYAASGRMVQNAKAVLFTICRNLSFDMRAKDKQETPLPDDDTMTSPTVDPAVGMTVQRALACLCAEEREIIVMYCVSGLKHREIAGILELPEGTVRWKYRQALKKLRRELGGEFIE